MGFITNFLSSLSSHTVEPDVHKFQILNAILFMRFDSIKINFLCVGPPALYTCNAEILTQWEKLNKINKLLKSVAEETFKLRLLNPISCINLGQTVLLLCDLKQ